MPRSWYIQVEGKPGRLNLRLAAPATVFFTRILDARKWNRVLIVGNPTCHNHPTVRFLQVSRHCLRHVQPSGVCT
jgi:hypothetical protein